MPSPFPGMDPFLEERGHFPDFHDRLIAALSGRLNRQLPPPYFTTIRNRVWVEESERAVEPDVGVLRPRNPALTPQGRGGVAVAEPIVTEPVVIRVPTTRTEVREWYLELHADPGGERLVACIEILSRANKRAGSTGREKYREKQREVIEADAHLVEIDLLRGETHTTAVPEERLQAAVPAFDYHVCVRRFDQPDDFFVYPWRLPDRLPTVALPLLPGTPDLPLDLGVVFAAAYDDGPYARRIDYRSRDFDPPLPSERLTWIDTLLAGR